MVPNTFRTFARNVERVFSRSDGIYERDSSEFYTMSFLSSGWLPLVPIRRQRSSQNFCI
jgi:hypothetical protein